jgi:hypothetical protein
MFDTLVMFSEQTSVGGSVVGHFDPHNVKVFGVVEYGFPLALMVGSSMP